MKSYFLLGLPQRELIETELDRCLPKQREPWVLLDEQDDAIAYFNIGELDEVGFEDDEPPPPSGLVVQADLSGRHSFEGEKVVAVLRQIRAALGGVVCDDDGERF